MRRPEERHNEHRRRSASPRHERPRSLAAAVPTRRDRHRVHRGSRVRRLHVRDQDRQAPSRSRQARGDGAPGRFRGSPAEGRELRRVPRAARRDRARLRRDAARSCPARPRCRTCSSTSRRRGLGAGLEEQLFQPTGEIQKDFYAELPIKLRYTGSYHELGNFVSGIAALPRIVTLHDIDIKPIDDKSLRRAHARRDREDLSLFGRAGRGGARATMMLMRNTALDALARGRRARGRAWRLRPRQQRPAGVHRRGQGSPRRPHRLAAASASGTDVRVRGGRPPVAVHARHAAAARQRRSERDRGTGSESAARVSRAVSARHAEDGRHAWPTGARASVSCRRRTVSFTA